MWQLKFKIIYNILLAWLLFKKESIYSEQWIYSYFTTNSKFYGCKEIQGLIFLHSLHIPIIKNIMHELQKELSEGLIQLEDIVTKLIFFKKMFIGSQWTKYQQIDNKSFSKLNLFVRFVISNINYYVACIIYSSEGFKSQC